MNSNPTSHFVTKPAAQRRKSWRSLGRLHTSRLGTKERQEPLAFVDRRRRVAQINEDVVLISPHETTGITHEWQNDPAFTFSEAEGLHTQVVGLRAEDPWASFLIQVGDEVVPIRAKWLSQRRPAVPSRSGNEVASTSRDMRDPLRVLRRGMTIATSLLAAAALLFTFSPVAGLVGMALAVIGWGVSILAQAALTPSSVHDSRLGTLLIVAGISTVIVTVVTALT